MRVELDLKKIKSSDLEAISNNIGSKEIYAGHDLNKVLDEFVNNVWENWAESVKMVYMFKLGAMIGKREERAKRLASGRRQK